MNNLIGKYVLAVGDCGMAKDKEVFGVLITHTNNKAIVKNGHRIYSVNPKTLYLYEVELVVCNENILGYIQPETRTTLNFLQSSILKGATSSVTATSKPINISDNIRLANEKDFSNFNVSFDGYKNDPQYKYEK